MPSLYSGTSSYAVYASATPTLYSTSATSVVTATIGTNNVPGLYIGNSSGVVFNQGAQGVQGTQGVQGIQGLTTFTTSTTDSFVGDGVQTNFTLSQTPIGPGYITVTVGGVVQTYGTSWALFGNTIVFSSPPPNGTIITIRYAGVFNAIPVQGVQGLQGPQGVQGIQGNTGAGSQGVQGTTGTQGVQGLSGSYAGIGAQGVQGTTGSQGVQGVQGLSGSYAGIGAQGVQGVQGSKGNTGTQGVQGVQGLTGSGIQGTTGPSGAQGTTGPSGPNSTWATLGDKNNSNGPYGISLGFLAGAVNQGGTIYGPPAGHVRNIALGNLAGYQNQGGDAISIGIYYDTTVISTSSAQVNQGIEAVSIGAWAGQTNQGYAAVALGPYAGAYNQAPEAIAIGGAAGQGTQIRQGVGAVSIGASANNQGSGDYSIAIGYLASANNVPVGNPGYRAPQSTSTIILNASGTYFSGVDGQTNSFYVNPVRQITNGSLPSGFYNMAYNPSTKEIIYWS